MFLISLFSSAPFSHGGIHFHIFSFLHLFFLSWWLTFISTLHLLGVSVGDTDEVGVGNTEGSGLGKDDEEVELLRHLGVSVGLWVTLSSEDGVVLVDEYIVADDPDGNQGGGDDSEHAGGEKFSSAGGGVLGEENNEEAGSNAHWGEEDQDNNWEVPVNVVIKDQEEVHSDQVDGKEDCEDTNSNDTTLNWEATAASRVLGILIGTSAEAAAARGKLLLSSDRNIFTISRLLLFHHWGHLVSHSVLHFVFHWKYY